MIVMTHEKRAGHHITSSLSVSLSSFFHKTRFPSPTPPDRHQHYYSTHLHLVQINLIKSSVIIIITRYQDMSTEIKSGVLENGGDATDTSDEQKEEQTSSHTNNLGIPTAEFLVSCLFIPFSMMIPSVVKDDG